METVNGPKNEFVSNVPSTSGVKKSSRNTGKQSGATGFVRNQVTTKAKMKS